ncbi:hypothetical protein FJT64_010690 [Amphibalanus amphitrite]|uniref:Uncharacterized protein n=1 Tax=Amphibalanus amphitrite TaxID=1232801 RepID=A0A6A4VHW6_AMPAM|nr:hypothetical protein FJT64_010690 [Amphibalanus amphitrite]
MQVRRGEEKLLVKTSHKDKSWRGYDLLKTTHHPTEPPGRRRTSRRVNKAKIDQYPLLSRALDYHVNVEIITNAFTCIKYVIKYVTKGAIRPGVGRRVVWGVCLGSGQS